MKSYLADSQLKKDFVKEVKRHYDADQIVQGTYGDSMNPEDLILVKENQITKEQL